MPNWPPANCPNTQSRKNLIRNNIHQGHPEDSLQIVYAIFGGGKLEHTPSKIKAYNIGSYRDLEIMQVNLTENAKSYPKNSLILITFTKDQAK